MSKKTPGHAAQVHRKAQRHLHNPQARFGKKHANASKLSGSTCLSYAPEAVPNEFYIGPFRVVHSRKQFYRLYTVFYREHLIGKQVSYPSALQCCGMLRSACKVLTGTESREVKILIREEEQQRKAAHHD